MTQQGTSMPYASAVAAFRSLRIVQFYPVGRGQAEELWAVTEDGSVWFRKVTHGGVGWGEWQRLDGPTTPLPNGEV